MNYEAANQLTKVKNFTRLYIFGIELKAKNSKHILFSEIKLGRNPIKVYSNGSVDSILSSVNIYIFDEIYLNSVSFGIKFQ